MFISVALKHDQIVMITLLVLLSLLCQSTQDGQGQEHGPLLCGPQNVTLTNSDQTLLMSWDDGPSCSASRGALTCELVVLIADKEVHHHEFPMTTDTMGSLHSWNWTSYLAPQCATHTVRLRYRNRNLTSLWKQEQIIPGDYSSDRKRIYPRDRVFEAGSKATFCCILQAGESFVAMSLSSNKGVIMNSTKISDQTYALTLHLNRSLDVKCKTNKSSYGSCVYVGYPPGDKDLQCETRDLESVECYWTVGRDTNISFKSPTTYQLLGRPCEEMTKSRCSQYLQVDAGERNWILTAKNTLGTVDLHDRADLTKRVHMYAPERVRASNVMARNVRLEWTWTVQQYNNINLTCQVHVRHTETSAKSETFGVGLNVLILNDLKPNWKYAVQLRCGTAQNFWKWGDWSKVLDFHTKIDVPDALDVWMHMEETQAVVIWKTLLLNQSHGDIIDYEVAWRKTGGTDQPNRTTVPASSNSLTLTGLETSKEHIATVTARNSKGSSSPSSITIPSLSLDRAGVNTSWITGINGSFTLSLPACPPTSCGFIVDWCPTLGNCTPEWLRVPPDQTDITISSEHFIDGLRYSLSIYACTQGSPVLLQRREGYVRETRIEDNLFKSLAFRQQDSGVEVSWEYVAHREQTAAIHGYTLYYQEPNSSVFNVSTDDLEATSLMVRNLNVSSYTFTMAAATRLGEGGHSSFTATLNSQTDNLVTGVLISLGAIFVLLSLSTVLCFRHWTCIRRKVYPPIPKPVLTDKWLTSLGQPGCRHLRVDQSSHREREILNIPQLLYDSGAAVIGSGSQEDTYVVLTQAHKRSGPLPAFLGRDVFPNPSYDLFIEAEAQRRSSGPEDEEGTPSSENSSGYQPQRSSETLNLTHQDPDSPISCVSNYILLPAST